jgi:hypothetical protein
MGGAPEISPPRRRRIHISLCPGRRSATNSNSCRGKYRSHRRSCILASFCLAIAHRRALSIARLWPPPLLPPDFSRHARRCCICSHPDRDAIEGDFIRWHSVELIAREYKIATRKSIYRHAHCTGLFVWRRRELGRVLEGILENAEHVPLVSSGVIVRAARIYAHLDENGNWFEPAHTNFILTAPASSLSPLGSDLLANSARAKPRPARRRKNPTKSNRNNRSFRKKLKSLNKKEKANS